MKKILLLVVCFISLSSAAQTLAQAEKDYADGRFSEALKTYQTLLPQAKQDTLYQVQLRIVGCQYMLGKYMQAAQSAFGFELSSQPLWQARQLLYRIQTAQRVQNTYRFGLSSSDEEEGDLEQLSAAQWQDKINESFEQLWTLRKQLIEAPIEKETLILELQDTDTKAIPTLFDFVLLQWKNQLENEAVSPLRAENMLSWDRVPAPSSKQDIQKLQYLLAEAAQLEGKNRADARLIWQTDRVTLPFDYPSFFTFDNQEKARQKAIEILQALSGYTQQTSIWNKLGRWIRSLGTCKADYGQAYAALKAARLLNQNQQYIQAAQLCDWSAQTLASNYYSQSCKQLAQEIRQPVLDIESPAFSQDPQHTRLSFSARNISTVYLRLYAVTQEELQKWNKEKAPTSWHYLTQIQSDQIPQLLTRTPLSHLSKSISYEKPHAFAKQVWELPPLEARGFYIAVLSYDETFNPQTAPVQAVVLNNTELALFVTAAIEDDPAKYHTRQAQTYTPPVFRIYTWNLQTGQPQPNAAVTYITDWKGNRSHGTTNDKGVLTLPQTIHVNGNDRSSFILPKAETQGSTAFLTNSVYFYFSNPQPVRLYLESDRAVYRPGQNVTLAVYGLEEAGRGLKTLPDNTKVQIRVRDVNGQSILDKTVSLNAYGTAKLSFTLPQEGLLGSYQVQATYKYDGRTANAYYDLAVEEYKRPEYEVSLSPAATLQYGKTAHITGKAAYYAGSPLVKAPVQYKVTRQYFRPFCWWWRPMPAQQPEIIAHGETTTDADGNFTISFVPTAGKDTSWPTTFHVEASVRDASGRAIDTTSDYKASQHAVFFKASFTKGFYEQHTAGSLAEIELTDINNQPIAGKFTAEIIELENVFSADKPTANFRQENSLENWYGKNKELRLVSTHAVTVEKGEPVMLNLPSLPEGIYKIKLSAKNAETAELVFLVAAPKSSLALPAVAIVQEKSYYPGSVAKILLGAQDLHGVKQLEIYDDGQFLAKQELLADGAEIYQLPILPAWRGGVYVRWFGASDYQMYQGQTFVQVPHDNQALSLTINVPDHVQPGERVSWKLTAKDAASNPINGQASLRVYDKSLDYYAAISPLLSMEKLYPSASLRTNFSDSRFQTYAQRHFTGRQVNDSLESPRPPRLNLQAYYHSYQSKRMFAARSAAAPMMLMAKSAGAADMAMNDTMEESAGAVAESERVAGSSAGNTPTPRTDFAETAYFNPMLPITAGKAIASFTFPQSLTAWNIQAFAFTPRVEIGSYRAQTVSRKDVMIRLSLPRFWREKDQSTLVAQVTNTTSKKRTAEITLDLVKDGTSAAAAFGIEKATQTISVPAGSTQAVTWKVSVPKGVGMAQITATVRSGNYTDAESRTLPLLPAISRVVDSITAALEDKPQTLRLENLLQPDDTREVSSVTLRLDPSLLRSVLNAMPQLLQPAYKDALSLVNSYAPLAVVQAFYTAYPLLQQAVGQLPKRNTQLPAWEEQDPSRLLLLSQTPWLQASKGGVQSEAFLADLFDPASVDAAKKRLEQKLVAYQTQAGGFSWMPGGQPSEFITLKILAAYGQILRYGGEVNRTSAEKALAWMSSRIENNLTQSTPHASTVSYALYAAYVYTAFPQMWKSIKQAPIQKWLDYADKHSRYMTPLGQTYAAAAYYRLGDKTKANEYLNLVLSRVQTNPVTGSYFAPEAQSWLWYNDTLATQTATLRTLLEIRPNDEQAAGLVKWILFNRKAQAWRDSASTAEAIYTLLDYMQRRGLLNDPAEYSLQWDGQKKSIRVEPFDWSGPLTWTKTAPDISEKDYMAQASKQGGLTSFVTLDAVYTTAQANASPEGVINVQRRYLLKYQEDGREKVRALQPLEQIPVGSEVEVELTVTTSSAFDYVLLSDPKPAGFENTDLTSGWTWNALSFYREVRDGATNFFIDRVPAGTYTLRYTLRPTLSGVYHALPAQIQSMYAPEFAAHTATNQLEVK